LGASQFCKCHSKPGDSEVKNPDLAQGLRSFATLHAAQDDKSGIHPIFSFIKGHSAYKIRYICLELNIYTRFSAKSVVFPRKNSASGLGQGLEKGEL